MPCPAVGRLLSPRQGWASPTTASTVRGHEIAVFPTDSTFTTILSLKRFRVNVSEARLRTAGLTDQAAHARREEFYADRRLDLTPDDRHALVQHLRDRLANAACDHRILTTQPKPPADRCTSTSSTRHEHPFMPLSVHPILSMNRDVA